MSIYKTYNAEQVETLLSDFLISSWSYSKVSQFTRNQKSFEMRYIYGIGSKSSATTIAGNAYHNALESYFKSLKMHLKDKEKYPLIDLPTLEMLVFEYIDGFPANLWKTQKTTPTVDDCKAKAQSTTLALLKNFFTELSTYIADIKEIIDVEVKCTEWVTINGVDIPMPCHAKIDLVFQSVHDKIVVVDHKSKAVFTDEQELRLAVGVQAITYVNCYESKTGINVDEVWLIENKYSKNQNKSQQLSKFVIAINKDVRRLYEVLLYEPLKMMIEAVNDPDYCYIINESDNYQDKAELYEFWGKTMIAEVEEFNVDPSKKQLVEKRLRKIRDASLASINPKVIKEFRKNAAEFIQYDLSNKDMNQQEKIEHILRTFGIVVNVAHKFDGYSSNTYLLEVNPGVKIASIHGHKLDIANALDVSTVRISSDLVVHEKKSYLSVEFSKARERILEFEPKDMAGHKIPIGRDNYENVIYWDLDSHSTTNVLMCGAVGSGKSVSIRSTIEYVLLLNEYNIIIFDPKYEFTQYNQNENVKVFNDILDIENEMARLVEYMNTLVKTGNKTKTIVFFDEFADAISAARKGNELKLYETVIIGNYKDGRAKTAREQVGELKSLEENLRILAQKGRSSGFKILAATQRASVEVISGNTKVNFPVIVCYKVPREVDSRVILDDLGGESLSGYGDGLFKSPEFQLPVRFQAYIKN